MPGHVIEVEGVSKRYRIDAIGGATDLRRLASRLLHRQSRDPRTFWALQDIDLEVTEGEVLGIIGRNGAGKSTLLRILARITEPTSGVARVRGRVGALLEVGTGFHPELSGRENVYLNGAILGMTRQDVRRRFDDIVEFAGVEQFIDTPLKRYSSGMELRLAFAVAAHLEPDILVIDEVLAVGDAEFQQRCLGRMNDLTGEGRTVLFVTHDHGAMARLVTRVVWLDRGRIVSDGPADEVMAGYAAATTPAKGARVLSLPGGGPLEVLEVHAVRRADGRDAPPRAGEPIELSVAFRLSDPAGRLDVGLYVTTADGVRVLHEVLSDERGAGDVSGAPGEYRVTLEAPPLLAEGSYLLGVWIGGYYEMLVDEDVLAFNVDPRPDDPVESLERRRILRPRVGWRLEQGAPR